MNNGHGIVSMIMVTTGITHQLWLPEQDKEWRWNHQHDHSHQHAWMHNSPPTIARVGWRVDMKWSLWPTCQNAQLTSYDFQNRMNNRHGIISMIAVTNILECITHPLWLPEQDKEWIWNHHHVHSYQHARNAQLTFYSCQRINNNETSTNMIPKLVLPWNVETRMKACEIVSSPYPLWADIQACVPSVH